MEQNIRQSSRKMDQDTRLIKLVHDHVIFPRRLPQIHDWNVEGLSQELLQLLLNAAKLMSEIDEANHKHKWTLVAESLASHGKIHFNNMVLEDLLLEALTNLGEGCMLILHVVEQNAGVLIIHDQM